jgi:sulfur carrier protein ThiS
MEAPTREEADAQAELFATKRGEMASLDEEITSLWSSLYYNKIYAYDLLMEREGNTSMLDFSAEATARAEREINENTDLYESNALVGYYARKKALTEYEMQIASTLSLTTSRDSLRLITAELKNRDYRLSKLSLQRRSFIDYEDITVKVPTIYNSKNPVPQTKVYDYGTVYRIRIGLFSKRPNVSALRGATPLSYTTAYNNGLYAYFVGGFRTEQEAKDGADYLKKLGFKEPIIAVWVDGEYYPTLEDMRRSESQYNIEISGVATLTDDMKASILAHKSDCTISRIGSTFVVGTFEGKSVAEAVVTELKAINSEINAKIIKKP